MADNKNNNPEEQNYTNDNYDFDNDITRLDDNTLANLTDEEIIEWAQGAEDFDRAVKLREDAQKRLKAQQNREQTEKNKKQAEKQQAKNNDKKTEGKQEQQQSHKENTKVNQDNNNKKTIKRNNTEVDLEKAKKRLKGKSKTELIEGSKSAIKKRNLSGKKIRVSGGKVNSKGLGQALVGTFVNTAIDTTEEFFEEAAENTAKNIINGQESKSKWNRVDAVHPDQMSDMDLAGLSDQEFEELKKNYGNGNQAKIDEWTQKRQQGEAINKYQQTINDYNAGDSKYYNTSQNRRPYEYNIPEYDYEIDSTTGKTKMNKTGAMRKLEVDEKNLKQRIWDDTMNKRRYGRTVSDAMDDVFSWMKKHKIGALDIGFNLFSSVSDYKNARREGHSVGSSLVRAAGSFVMGEMLGFWGSLGVGLAKGVPKLAIKGVELMYKENRRMNSAANNQVFGNAEFHDTQQLATMRQSGMEMAKMAQYNLQQTLMGNEATYLHR